MINIITYWLILKNEEWTLIIISYSIIRLNHFKFVVIESFDNVLSFYNFNNIILPFFINYKAILLVLCASLYRLINSYT